MRSHRSDPALGGCARGAAILALVWACGPTPAQATPGPAAHGSACDLEMDPPVRLAVPASLASALIQRGPADVTRTPILFRDDKDQSWLADPTNLSRVAREDSNNRMELWTATRRYAIGYDYVVRVASGDGPLTPVHGPVSFDRLDYVSERAGRTLLVGLKRGDKNDVVELASTLDASLTASAPPKTLTRGIVLGVAELPGGGIALVTLNGGRDRTRMSLSLVWVDPNGTSAAPVSIASGAISEAAVTAEGADVVVAYTVLHVDKKAEDGKVPATLSAVRVGRHGRPAPLFSQGLATIAWTVAGSAGGILPLELQAVTVGSKAVLGWLELGDEFRLRLGTAQGPSKLLLPTKEGWRLLQGSATGDGSIVVLHRQDSDHSTIAIRCRK